MSKHQPMPPKPVPPPPIVVARRMGREEMRAADDRAAAEQAFRELPQETQHRLNLLRDSTAIIAQANAHAVEADAKIGPVDLSASMTVERRSSDQGLQWRCVTVVTRAGKRQETTTKWLPRAVFFAEIAVIRQNFNSVVFDGIGNPIVG